MKEKRLILVAVLMIVVAVGFWSGSRYPALNEKVAMGADTSLSGIGFESLVSIAPDASTATRILYTSINWTYTNKEGMTFGIVFGTLLMGFLRLVNRRITDNRVSNTAIGVLIGVPLGVCVNCAAPIAKAMHDVNGRAETMLATMISSPTLNIIVITLLFGLFPLNMALLKIGLTIGFILVAIPTLTWLFPIPASGALASLQRHTQSDRRLLSANQLVLTGEDRWHPGPVATWFQAIRWVVERFAADLWFLSKTTVPLMLLAGLLGAALVIVVPLESLADILPDSGRYQILLGIAGVALIGTFLPVPIAFDVIVAAVLWQAGLPVQYTMALLFTLGIFSIFPFFVVWRALSPWIATSLFLALAALGIVAGVLGYWSFESNLNRQEQIVADFFGNNPEALRGPTVLNLGSEIQEAVPYDELASTLRGATMSATPVQRANRDGIRLERTRLREPVAHNGIAGQPDRLFRRFEASRFGIGRPNSFSANGFQGPYTQFRGIASGDVHNDGWSDILLSFDAGVSLYANREGKRFTLQQIEVSVLEDVRVVLLALVDFDNDGWLDIFVATYKSGNYVIYNSEGSFSEENLRRLPDITDSPMIGAAAFGDLDMDGDLDVVTGGWRPPIFHGIGAMKHNSQVLLQGKNGEFLGTSLPATPGGQILSILLSDFDVDGILDLIIGAEDSAPDTYFLGTGDGRFRPIRRQENIISQSAGSTMSIASADINNDLLPEIYIGQIVSAGEGLQRNTGPEICDEIEEPNRRNECRRVLKMHESMPSQTRKRSVQECLARNAKEFREDCIAYYLLLTTIEQGPEQQCNLFPDSWRTFRASCKQGFNGGGPLFAPGARPYDVSGSQTEYWNEAIPVVMNANVLLTQSGDGRFIDTAEQLGVSLPGFTWNAKFADLDNDEFTDLYVATGWFPSPRRSSNVFYHNLHGDRFLDETEDAGLTSFLATSAYTYSDLDNDGDLDIVTVPIIGPVTIFINGSMNNRIVFELRDQIGNHFGIGSKITIHYGLNGIRHQQREIKASGGFVSFDAPIAHFGLGEFRNVERVEILWSNGEVSELQGEFAAGDRYVITRKDSPRIRR